MIVAAVALIIESALFADTQPLPDEPCCVRSSSDGVIMSSATQRRGLRRWLRRYFVLSLPPLIIVITLVFWQALSRQEQGNIAQGIELSAGYIRDEIVQALEADTRALGRMGRRWEVAGKPLQAIWEADATQYIRDTPDY